MEDEIIEVEVFIATNVDKDSLIGSVLESDVSVVREVDKEVSL
jgi:hypothetical protein